MKRQKATVQPAPPDKTVTLLDTSILLNAFVMQNGRIPMLGDEIPPWKYRGWMLYQIQVGHFHPDVCNRWGYYLRTLQAGKLLDEPIPRIEFDMQHPKRGEAQSMLRKALDIMFQDAGSWSAFPALIDWLAWAVGLKVDEPRVSEKTNEALYRHFNFGPMLLAPYDYLGALYSEGKTNSWNVNAFYPTPHNLIEMMVRMQMYDGFNLPGGRDPRTATVCDPCVGSGRMLLHASNYSFCLYGMDIDRTCVNITKINGVLYAPWLTFPFPAELLGIEETPAIAEGNALTAGIEPPKVETPVFTTAEPRFTKRGQGLLF
jgi:hypothetical protein